MSPRIRHPRPSWRGARTGSTLVETIVSLGLILLIALFIFQLFASTRRGIQISENRASAAMLGRSLLDDARRGGFDSVAAGSGTSTFAGRTDGNPWTVTMAWTRSVQSLDTNKKLIWIQVTWREPTGTKQVVLETILQK